jgi:hypothetical protein
MSNDLLRHIDRQIEEIDRQLEQSRRDAITEKVVMVIVFLILFSIFIYFTK